MKIGDQYYNSKVKYPSGCCPSCGERWVVAENGGMWACGFKSKQVSSGIWRIVSICTRKDFDASVYVKTADAIPRVIVPISEIEIVINELGESVTPTKSYTCVGLPTWRPPEGFETIHFGAPFTHSRCGGCVDKASTTEKFDVFSCRKCNLRFFVPSFVITYQDFIDHFAKMKDAKFCRHCGQATR